MALAFAASMVNAQEVATPEVEAVEDRVAQVNGETITAEAFSTRVSLERTLLTEQINRGIAFLEGFGLPDDQIAEMLSTQAPYSSWLIELDSPEQLGYRVLTDMIEDELVRQQAAQLGVSVTDEEVEKAINDFFGYDPNPNVDERRDLYSEFLSRTSVSGELINDYFAIRALRKNLRDAVLTDQTNTDTFVNVRHILVATQEEAQQAIEAINAGTPFAEVAADVSLDSGSASQGGELSWAQPRVYVEEFADAVQNAPVGELIGPVETQFGFHVIEVMEREERSITQDELEAKLDYEFNRYLDGLRDDETNEIEIFDTWADNIPEEPVSNP